MADVTSAVRSAEKEESPRCGVPTIEDADSPSPEFTKKKARLSTSLLESGGDLLSRTVTSQVPSALKGLTSVFGMGTGGTPSSLLPEMVSCLRKPFSLLYCVSVCPGLPVFLFFLLQARRCFHTLTTAQYRFSSKDCFQLISESRFCNQALDRLVSSSSMCYHTSTDDLSTR